MDKEKAQNAIAPKTTTGISAKEKEEMKIASRFADDHTEEMKKMIRKVQEMWGISLLWDSKVPKKNKKFYYWFSLTPSDREEVITEINSYLEFYKEMSTAVNKIYTDEGKSDSEKANPQTIIAALREKLENMLKQAKSGEELTSSSTACDLHKEFIAAHEKLECMIKNVEIVSLKQGVVTANNRCDEALQKIDRLEKKLDDTNVKTDNLCDRIEVMILQIDQLTAQNREMQAQKEQADATADRLQRENEILLEYVRQELENRQRRIGGNET